MWVLTWLVFRNKPNLTLDEEELGYLFLEVFDFDFRKQTRQRSASRHKERFLQASGYNLKLSPTDLILQKMLEGLWEELKCRYAWRSRPSKLQAQSWKGHLKASQWLYDFGREALRQVDAWPDNDKAVPQKFPKPEELCRRPSSPRQYITYEPVSGGRYEFYGRLGGMRIPHY